MTLFREATLEVNHHVIMLSTRNIKLLHTRSQIISLLTDNMLNQPGDRQDHFLRPSQTIADHDDLIQTPAAESTSKY